MEDKQLLWNRYSMHIDLYQKYLDVAIKLNLFYYGITGAILSFYFSQKSNNTISELALVLPILFSVALFVFFAFADKSYAVSKTDIEKLVSSLGMDYYVRTDALIYIFRGSMTLIGLTTLGLLYVFCSKTL
jgi:hypothetical protein